MKLSREFVPGFAFLFGKCYEQKKVTEGFDKPVKEFILSKVAGLQPATLLKNEFFRRHFSKVLIIAVEHLFCRTPLNGCFCMEKPKLFIYGFCFIVHIRYILLIRDEKLQNALCTWRYFPLLRHWHK